MEELRIPAQRRPPPRRPPPGWKNIGPWNKTNETREAYGIRTLDIAFDVHFDKDDRDFHGDIRYDGLQRKHNRTLASEGGRWSDTVPLEPLKVEDLIIGQTYRLGDLPLGSKFIMPDGSEKTLNYFNYAPRPSKGATIKVSPNVSEENNGWMTNKGAFTALGIMSVTFVSHPHKRIKPAKSATALRARTRSPSRSQSRSHSRSPSRSQSRSSRYKKEIASRQRRVKPAKKTRRRKRGSRAKSVSVDKLSPMRSTRRRSR
jgi:hypothetical protein